MLKLDSNTAELDTQKYHSLIFRFPKAFINIEYLDWCISRDTAIIDGYLYKLFKHMYAVSGKEYTEIKPGILIDYLVEYEEVPLDMFEYFDNKARQVLRTTKLERIQYIVSRRFAEEFFSIYIPYAESVYRLNNIRKKRERMVKSKFIGYNGKPMYNLHYYYSRAITGRTYTKQDSIQAMAKEYLSSIQAPMDYYILWCDFKQIDLRVAMEICLRHPSLKELDEYMELYDDRYEAFARYMYHVNNLPFSDEDFAEQRPKLKQGILACMYQSSERALSSSIGDPVFASRLYKTINTNPRYMEYMKSLKSNTGIPEVFTTKCYFGTERRSMGGEGVGLNERSIFNTPIQGTSQEIMELFTRKACEVMDKCSGGNTKFFPLLNRHDEQLFMVHKSLLPYLNKVVDLMKIQVDDWSTIELDWDIGTKYKEPDIELKEGILDILINEGETQAYKSQRLNKYYPSELTFEINFVEYEYQYDSYRMCYKFEDTFTESKMVFSRPFYHDRNSFISACINDAFAKEISEGDYKRVVIYSNYDDYMEVNGKEVFVINKEGSSSYMHYLGMLKALSKKHIESTGGVVPDELGQYEHSNLDKGVQKVWWI